MPRRPRRLVTISLDAECWDRLVEQSKAEDRDPWQHARRLLVHAIDEGDGRQSSDEPVTADVA